jgi:hypothetical protein
MLGGVVDTLEVNADKANVLPGSVRKYTAQYNGKWMIGKYTADLALGFGTTGQAIVGSTSFWMLPYKLIIILLLTLSTIIYILFRLIKVYNNHIIKKSKNEKIK